VTKSVTAKSQIPDYNAWQSNLKVSVPIHPHYWIRCFDIDINAFLLAQHIKTRHCTSTYC